MSLYELDSIAELETRRMLLDDINADQNDLAEFLDAARDAIANMEPADDTD